MLRALSAARAARAQAAELDEPTNVPLEAEGVALSVRGLSVAYDRKAVLQSIDLDVPDGALVGIVGPNGAGKSTLIKAMLDLVPPADGEVSVYGKPYKKQRSLVGYVPQRESVDWDFPVSALDVVTMGQYGRIGLFRPIRARHHAASMAALEKVGMAEYAKRQISQLSGGQQQRVFLARALVQEAKLYLMDEPFAGVDAATERSVVDTLRGLQRAGCTLMVVHHDLNTAADYFDHVLLLNKHVIAFGPTARTFTPANLQKAYGGRLVLA
ncbi:MAG: metal ABC transporter ATP-binding protein [Phycisphaerae bacterium]